MHDLNFLYFPQFLTSESIQHYERQIEWAVRTADHIAVDSESTRRDLIKQLNAAPDKVSTVHLAASSVYAVEPRRIDVDKTLIQLNLPRDFVLFVGTLEPRKNLPTLFQAYEILRREKGYMGPLVLAGGRGWLDDAIFSSIEKLGLGQSVIHVAGLDDRRLAHLYRAASVLALPSFYEGFGLPVLEAMQCDCPVVSSNRGSLPEVVGNAGIVLEPEDVEGWVVALDSVLKDDDLRKRMVIEGRAQAATFSWQKTARSMLSIYHNV